MFRQGRWYRESRGERVYRNLPIAFALSVFALRVEVRIGRDGVLVRNVFTTRRLRSVDILAIRSVPAYAAQFSVFGGFARTVAFELADGRELRSMALRRNEADADVIADDLTELAGRLGVPSQAGISGRAAGSPASKLGKPLL